MAGVDLTAAGAMADAITRQNVSLQSALLSTYDDNEKAAFDEGRLIGAAQIGGLLMAAQIGQQQLAAQAPATPAA